MLFCRQGPKNPSALALGRPTMKSYPESLGLVCSIAPDGVQPKPLVLLRGIPRAECSSVCSDSTSCPFGTSTGPSPLWCSCWKMWICLGADELRVEYTLCGLRRMYPIVCSGCGLRTPSPVLHPQIFGDEVIVPGCLRLPVISASFYE